MDVTQLLTMAVEKKASDIFIIAGLPLTCKINGSILRLGETRLMPEDTASLIGEIYRLAGDRDSRLVTDDGDDDFSFALKGVSRFRVCTYKQRGSLAAVIRVVNFTLPNPADLGIPENILQLADRTKGLVLVTGPAGSGKSTTLACIIDRINHTRSSHVITLEDPLEYLHSHNKSIVSQREISSDTVSYVTALRAALRQSPDVILLGEMRDYETINVAMTAAETGHLIISTLHTIGAAKTIDRIIDAFPPNQQHQIRLQLSMVLQAVVSQQLIPTVDGGIVPAFELMFANGAIRNMIRESKTHQIDSAIFSGANEGMVAMDTSIYQLYTKGIIAEKDALLYSTNPDMMNKRIRS